MARGLNRVMLIGHLGADPETRYTTSNNAISSIRVATSEQWKDKDTGEKNERTEWHRVVFFGRLAEVVNEYLRKGALVHIEGSIRTRKWTDHDGTDRYSTEIVASEMNMLGGRADGGDSTTRSNRSARGRSHEENPPASGGYAGPPAGSPEDFDDDIPF